MLGRKRFGGGFDLTPANMGPGGRSGGFLLALTTLRGTISTTGGDSIIHSNSVVASVSSYKIIRLLTSLMMT